MDNNGIFNGNSTIRSNPDGDGHERSAIARPLVEECIPITLADLRQLFGRKELLKAAEDARPIHIQIHGNAFSIQLLAQPHRLPGRGRGVSDREVPRLWLCCMGCRGKTRKLFTYPKFPGSQTLYMPLCRSCHCLVYQSQNCGGNKWWRESARPLKRLLRRRERLLNRKQSAEVLAQLEKVDQQIWIMRQRVKPESSPGSGIRQSAGGKRPYRDLSPILQSLPC